jgi:hypothetical protein
MSTHCEAKSKGTRDAIEAMAKGSHDPRWGELLSRMNHTQRGATPTKEPPRFALDSLAVTTSFPPLAHGASTSIALAKFHLIATNVGESTAHGWKVQIAMMDVSGARMVPNLMEAKGGVVDDTEPGRSQVFSINFPVVIPAGCGPQIIRVWMKCGDAINPKDDPVPQVFYRRWGGWNNPDSITEVDANDVKPIEAMFAHDFPMPQ